MYMLWIFQNVALHSKLFLSVWFQIKHQVGMQRLCHVFVSPYKELHLIRMHLSCDSSQLWMISGVLEIHHVIGIQTKSALIFMEQILFEMAHGKIVMRTKCKQLSNFKTLWFFINNNTYNEIMQYNEIYFVLLDVALLLM